MMEHQPEQKIEPTEINQQDEEMKNSDKDEIQRTETTPYERTEEAMEVQSDGGRTLEDQDIDMHSNDKEKTDTVETDNNEKVFEVMDIQICPAEGGRTQDDQDTEMKSIDKEKIHTVDNKITEKTYEEMEIQMEAGKTPELSQIKGSDEYDLSNKSILEKMEDNCEKETENVPTTDKIEITNTAVIDLSDEDQTEMNEQINNENDRANNINLKEIDEYDSNNESIIEKMEDNNEKEMRGITTTENNKDTNAIIIDLCDEDQTEKHDQVDRESIQANNSNLLTHKEIIKPFDDGGNYSAAQTTNVISESEEKGKEIGTIQIIESIICDESENESDMDTTTIKEISNAELKTSGTEGGDEPEAVCEIPFECCPKSVKAENPNIEKDISTIRSEDHMAGVSVHGEDINTKCPGTPNPIMNDGGCLENLDVSNEEKREATIIKDKPGVAVIGTKNEEYEIENFRFKDDIITLQEDYGMDTKQVINESAYDQGKSEISEEAKFIILDESDSDEKRCDTKEKILGCESEDINEKKKNTVHDVCDLQKQEPIELLKKGSPLIIKLATENSEQIKNEPELKEEEEMQLSLIKREIEDGLKHSNDLDIKEDKEPKIKKDEDIKSQSEPESEDGQHEDNSYQVPSTPETANLTANSLEGDPLEIYNQLTPTAEVKIEPHENDKSARTSPDEEELCVKDVQLIINLDIVKSEEKHKSIITKLGGDPGCSVKGGDSKICQLQNTEDANGNPASAYLNDTPPSLSDSDSNEEFFDAVEYIPEGTAAQETSLTIKPSTVLISTPSHNLINEPIPGPSGISIKKIRDEKTVVKVEEEAQDEEAEDDFHEATEFSSDEDTQSQEVERETVNEQSSPKEGSDIEKKKESRKHEDLGDNEECDNRKKMKSD